MAQQSITLQTSDADVNSGDVLGRVNFAASNESSGSEAKWIGASVFAEASGEFTASVNPTNLVFATSDADGVTTRLKLTNIGHLWPNITNTYDLGSASLEYRSIYANTGVLDRVNATGIQLTASASQSGLLYINNSNLISSSPNVLFSNADLASPKLIFKASGTTTPDLSLNILTTASGTTSGVQTLSIQGSAGELFSITDVLDSGTIFSVNDISGLSLIEADASGVVTLVRYGTNVAIGDFAPTQKLHVGGNLRVSGAIYDSLNSPGTSGQVLVSTAVGTDWKTLSEIVGVDGVGTSGYLAKWIDAETISSGIIYDNGTNIGIGDTNPSDKLVVNGRTRIDGTNKLCFGASTGGWADIGVLVANSGTIVIRNYDGAAVQERMRIIGTNGNVGINSTSPTAKLHIETGAATTTGVIVRGAAAQSAALQQWQDSAGTATAYIDAGGNIYSSGIFKSTNVGNNSGFRISYAGLTETVSALGTIVGNNIIAGSTVSTVRRHASVADSGNFMQLMYDRGITFHTGLTSTLNTDVAITTNERMRIALNGNVGIGTTSPNNLLHVNGVAQATTLYATDRVATTGVTAQYISDGSNLLLHSGSGVSANVIIGNSATEAIRITSVGNVGIGTTSPTQKLDVRGSVFISGALYDSTNSAGTNGQVLTSTATGTDWKSLSEITGVDGVGTSGYIARWIDTDTIGTGIIYDNGINVGIGTASPAARLHMRRTSGDFIRLGVNDANANGIGANIEWYTNEAVSADYLGGLRMQFSGGIANANRQMQFLVGDVLTPKAIINGDGNLGIGNTSPSYRIYSEVNSNSPGNPTVGLGIRNINAGTSADTRLYIGNDSGANAGQIVMYANAHATRANELSISNNINDSTSKITFATNNSVERMRINSVGNVGIGTTAQTARLHLVSSGTSSSTFAFIAQNTTPTNLIRISDDGRLIFGPSSSNPRISAYQPNGGDGVTPDLTEQGRALLFYTNYGGPAAGGGYFTFNSAGSSHSVNNDGSSLIAFRGSVLNANATTNSSYSTLAMNPTINQTTGTSTIRGIYYAPTITSASGVTHRAIETTRGDILFQNVSTPLFYIQETSGIVGIGTSSPTARLHIQNSSATVTGVIIRGAAAQSADLQQWQNSAGTALVRVDAAGSISGVASGIFMGRVGVGTSTPASALDTRSSGIAGLIVQTSNNQNIFQYLKGDGTNLLRGTWDGGNFHHYMDGSIYHNLNNFSYTFDGNSLNGSVINIKNNAYISLNSATTTAPGNANIWAGPNAYATSGQFTSISPFAFSTWAWNGANGFTITSRGYLKQTQQSATTGDARLSIARGTDDLELFTVNYSGGNIGIGTTSPTQRLHVSGNMRLTGAFFDSLNVPGVSGQVLVSTSGGVEWRTSSGGTIDGTGSANYLARWIDADTLGTGVVFDNGTNVGIRTTSPSTTLDVRGSGYFSDSIRTSGTVVFASGNTGTVGVMQWDSGEGTVTLGLKGGNVTANLAQDNVILCYNGTGSSLAKGQVVYVSGAQGQRPSVNLALGTSDLTSARTIGLVDESIGIGAEGFVSTFGVVTNLDTSAFTAGSGLWLSPTTPGAITMTRPVAPNHGVFLGWCLNSHVSAGRIFVEVQNGLELEELHDVLIQSVASGNLLQYDSSNSTWRNRTPLQAGLVEGVGTSGYVARWTGTNTAGTGVIYDNGTNVGVGTTSPTAKLHVVGSGQFTAGIYTNNIEMPYIMAAGRNLTNDLNLYALDAADSYLYVTDTEANGSGVIIVGDKAGVFASGVRSTVAIGNVALASGTDAPWSVFIGRRAGYTSESLGVSVAIGASAFSNAKQAIPGSDIGFSTAVGYAAGANARLSGRGSTFIGGSAGQNIVDSSHNTFVGINAGYYSSGLYYTVGIGSVAFGNVSPSYTDGTINSEYSVGIGASAGSASKGFNNSIAIGKTAGAYASGNNNIYFGVSCGLRASGSYNFELLNSGTSLLGYTTSSNKLHINRLIAGDFETKKVAIGNITSANLSPDATLEVLPKTTTDVGVIIQGVAAQTADLFQVQNSAGATLLDIDAAGSISGVGSGIFMQRVGVGTSTPDGALDVVTDTNGSFYFGNKDDTFKVNTIVFRQATHSSEPEGYAALCNTAITNSSNSLSIGGGSADHNAFTSINLVTASDSSVRQGTTRLRIISNGNVGIATATPVYPLDVRGSGYFSNGVVTSGRIGINITEATPTAMLDIRSNSATVTGVIVRGASAQTADLLQVQNSAGTTLFDIDAAGSISGVASGIFDQNLRVANIPSGTTETDVVLVKTDGTFVKRPSSSLGVGGGSGISNEDSIINALIFG